MQKGEWKILDEKKVFLDTEKPVANMADARRCVKAFAPGDYTVVKVMGELKVRIKERRVVETVVDTIDE